MSREEVRRLIAAVDDSLVNLIVTLLYGTGMRLLEGLRLRVKDVDFGRGEIVVREGKGDKDRVTMSPASLTERLRGVEPIGRGGQRPGGVPVANLDSV